MDAPALSSYWVKFFKSAGFPTEHATRHALIFSNNRIKPDMLPDLDKPSLKEMGITLMGDMIAILRYAKKVVEETTCKKFLVGSEDSPTPASKVVAKPTVKKVVSKAIVKTPASSKAKSDAPAKVIKTAASSVIKPASSVTVKKKVTPTSTIIHSKLYSDYIENNQKPKVSPLKRKYESDEDDSDGKWKRNEELQKRLRALSDDDDDEDDVEELKFKVLATKKTAVKGQNILKKALEQKKTVFHRLGDSMVSSTTSSTESSNPTFKVTGIGKERNATSSVFNRLGIKDNETPYSRHLRNGGSVTATQGILKSRTPLLGTKVITTKNSGTKIITTKSAVKKPVGTMRADEEANKKAVSESVRQLVRTTKSLKFNESPARSAVRSNSLQTRKLSLNSKLASERMAVPAKSRLGISKQVSFNKIAPLNHNKKQGVFSRLGV
ncbi:uncharacterized protein C19orf47 [Nasonia vitripennis]|uniref:SAM domain-containing protein n=1 Tax=Nasonia vitripennis TaxID=7425 RepID=A0A7M7ILP6_NASVI|nr:uncharacterized protein C19orf47 [Nasonia vitripennis]